MQKYFEIMENNKHYKELVDYLENKKILKVSQKDYIEICDMIKDFCRKIYDQGYSSGSYEFKMQKNKKEKYNE